MAYRFGGCFFCELPFYVNRHVLIPRFDTEVLVEAVVTAPSPEAVSRSVSAHPVTPAACHPSLQEGKLVYQPRAADKQSLKTTGEKESFSQLKTLADSPLAKRGGPPTAVGCAVLDLCTGSGCIAIVLAKHDFRVTASDISKKALRVARKNARLHDVDVEFVRGDLFEVFRRKSSPPLWRGGMPAGRDGVVKFDVIVSNPPYIKTGELGKWDESTLHEPRVALDGGADGLDFYRRIASEAGDYLNDGGRVFLEVCKFNFEAVKSLLQKSGFCDIQVIKDKAGGERVITCRMSTMKN